MEQARARVRGRLHPEGSCQTAEQRLFGKGCDELGDRSAASAVQNVRAIPFRCLFEIVKTLEFCEWLK
jgi:hypothetical protein